jgi:DnaJ-class molecular chaperone
MLQKAECPMCQGSGVTMLQTSAMWGLVKRDVPVTCDNCRGSGFLVGLPACTVCTGHGLLGNESEVCRSCNGTGKMDSFALIPTDLLVNGTIFHRRCEQCNNDTFEIRSEIEHHKVFNSWEAIEELRSYELIDRVKVGCTVCNHGYHIQIDPAYHQDIDPDTAIEFERLGLNLNFLYQARPGRPAAQPDAQRV